MQVCLASLLGMAPLDFKDLDGIKRHCEAKSVSAGSFSRDNNQASAAAIERSACPLVVCTHVRSSQ